MTGLVMRIAQSLGLHRDGTKFGLSPFDTEMRRRLWWQVCILDVRASEDHGSDPGILDLSFDTEFPLSINDEDLDPEATEFPVPRPGVSEMTFCLIRYEICALSRKLTCIPPSRSASKSAADPLTLEEKQQLVKDCAERLEDKYLKYCEDAGPLYWVAATVSRLIIAKMSLVIYHPLTQPGKPNNLPQDIKDRLFMASIEIIEYSRILESEISTKQWGWLFHTYIQWHAIAYILGELTLRNRSAIVDRAWRAVDGVFNDWGVAVTKSKSGMLWQPMRKLMAKARRKREENMQTMDSSSSNLGMDSKYVRPPPSGPGSFPARGCLIAQPTDTRNILNNEIAASQFIDDNLANSATMNMAPQVVGMGMLAPEQIQLQLQQQQAQMLQQNAQPWLMDDSALLDLDMNALDGDVNWEGWDDLVRDFQMEADNQPEMTRGPALGGMGSWW